MRMVCPNCGAQYEVADDVIPESGRDVQCSNCGHTWFETPGASAAEEAEIDMPVPADQEVVEEPTPAETETVEANAPSDPVNDGPQRTEMDPSVAEILREETEREEAARAAEQGAPLESQTEMGLADAEVEPKSQRTQESEDRIARLRGEEENAAAVAAAAAASRKELLPDIEEINSTLRSSEERGEIVAPEPEVVEKQKKRGFRGGFYGVLLIIILLILLYIFADPIKAMIPASASALDSYVGVVDSGRLWLDSMIAGLRDSMQSAVDANNEG